MTIRRKDSVETCLEVKKKHKSKHTNTTVYTESLLALVKRKPQNSI